MLPVLPDLNGKEMLVETRRNGIKNMALHFIDKTRMKRFMESLQP